MKTKKPYRTSGGENCWFTPPHIIEATRAVLGAIDLDPASCAEANEVVRAKKFYTAEDDGLEKPWRGRVWLNPPFRRGLIEPFVYRLINSRTIGHVSAALLLTNNSTDTGWWQHAHDAADGHCFIRRRVRFILPRASKRKTTTPMQGQVVHYFGPNPIAFAYEFSALGLVRAHGRAA